MADKAGRNMSRHSATQRTSVRLPQHRVRYRVAAICLLLGCLAACSSAPPEQRLRERIAAMQAAVEDGQPGEFMSGVAEDFVGEGGMDRRQLRGFLAAR